MADSADPRQGEEVGARDSAGDGAISQKVAKWLQEPVEGLSKYERVRRSTTLTPYHEVLKYALMADAHRAKRKRRTARPLCAEIQATGYEGGYTRVT